MEEANFDLQSAGDTDRQNFCLCARRFASAMDIHVSLGTQATKVPALPIFHGRGTIRVEDIALIEHGVCDLFHDAALHVPVFRSAVPSAAASKESRVRSQVRIP